MQTNFSGVRYTLPATATPPPPMSIINSDPVDLSKPIGRDGSPSRPTLAAACKAGVAQHIGWCRQARRGILPKRDHSGFSDQKFVLSSVGVKNVKN